MKRTKKELMDAIKEKSPELYEEILTESEKEFVEEGYCNGFGPNGGFHHGRGQGGQGFGGGGYGRGGGRGPWGGRRCGAGRPKMFEERKTITKQIQESTVEKIKQYAADNSLSENEALDRLINAGYESLKN
ncbi:MAG: hypothetical protein PHE78_03455 [Candidatus Gastranaerophilales bacterium]|nr:hypothetical protein [Candidatus Gastranaerophilales bacterium]